MNASKTASRVPSTMIPVSLSMVFPMTAHSSSSELRSKSDTFRTTWRMLTSSLMAFTIRSTRPTRSQTARSGETIRHFGSTTLKKVRHDGSQDILRFIVESLCQRCPSHEGCLSVKRPESTPEPAQVSRKRPGYRRVYGLPRNGKVLRYPMLPERAE